jgi:hypothetical protein
MSEEWQPIETAPRDGTVIRLRQGNLAPCHAQWTKGEWYWIEFQHPSKPTEWQPLSEPSVNFEAKRRRE